jgi:hypothetical protein
VGFSTEHEQSDLGILGRFRRDSAWEIQGEIQHGGEIQEIQHGALADKGFRGGDSARSLSRLI